MQTSMINTDEAPNKFWALQDRRMRNIANRSHYSAAEQVRAEAMRMVLTLVYGGIVYEPSYGKKGISIKVVGLVADKKGLKDIEADWTKQGIIKKVSPQGIIYRIQ